MENKDQETSIHVQMPESMVDVASFLSEVEVEFLKRVHAYPGGKYPMNGYEGGLYVDGDYMPYWSRPEKMGLVESVGSYKWIPKAKLTLKLFIDKNELK